MRLVIPVLVLTALALAANMTYIVTPSGNIHIVYVDNGTSLVVNINNNKVITVNLKLNLTTAQEQYYLHLVGQIKGKFSNATIANLTSILRQLNGTSPQRVPDLLLRAASLLLNSNETSKVKTNVMLVVRSLNSTMPNATYLKMKIEREVERKLARFNNTRLTPEDEWEIKIFTKDLNKTADLLAAIAARLSRYNITGASELLSVSQFLKRVSPTVRELEAYINGTKVEIKRVGNGYKIEIEREDKKKEEKSDEEKKGGSSKDDEKKSSGGSENKKGGDDKKSGGGEKNDKKSGSGGDENGGEKDNKSGDKEKKKDKGKDK